MRKKIVIAMSLSTLEHSVRSCGGVDCVSQSILNGLINTNRKEHDYLIIAFNPANDTEEDGKHVKITNNISVKLYNQKPNRFSKIKKTVPNFIWQNLIIRKAVAKFNPDILHVHSPHWLLFRYGNIKKIITLHSYKKIARSSFGLFNDFLFEKIIQPMSINKADIITTVSKDIYDIISNINGVRVRYIPNPVNDIYTNIIRKEHNLKDCLSIMMTGNVEPRKRTIDALKIISILRREYPNIKLIIAGKYNNYLKYYAGLKKFITKTGILQNVVFTGELNNEELIGYYQKIDIGIFLSESETFGLAPLEMMAAGIPTITTKVGIVSWEESSFIDNGAKIVKPRDINQVISLIRYFIKKPDNELKANLKAYISKKFNVNKIVNEYLRIYE